jgi:hypothetical protein
MQRCGGAIIQKRTKDKAIFKIQLLYGRVVLNSEGTSESLCRSSHYDGAVAGLVALKSTLIRTQQKYGHQTSWKYDDWESECKAQLAAHVAKGDPLDVAAYAMFCWSRG